MIQQIADLAKSRVGLAVLAAAFGATVASLLLKPSETPRQPESTAVPLPSPHAGGSATASEAATPQRSAKATPPAAALSSSAGSFAPPLAPQPQSAISAAPFEQALMKAAETLFEKAQIDPTRSASATRLPLVIDPLVDGVAGIQTVATRTIGSRLAALIASRYPKYEVRRFSADSLDSLPLVLLGTFTSVNAEGNPSGVRESYRVWLTLIDLATGKIVGKARAYSRMEGIDSTPTAAFRDAPAWTRDPATVAYIEACQKSRVGDPINIAYAERIRTAAMIAEAIEQYEASQYHKSLGSYVRVLLAPEGNQLRVHTGVYLNHWKLKNHAEAGAAFARVVDFGLEHRLLAMKFEFRPGSAAFGDGGKGVTVAAQYPLWINTIASKVARTGQCLELTGHSSPTGPEPLNERLSFRRAEFVSARLARESPTLGKRMISGGAGSSTTMIGTGRDDDSDALDRRVELKLFDCNR